MRTFTASDFVRRSIWRCIGSETGKRKNNSNSKTTKASWYKRQFIVACVPMKLSPLLQNDKHIPAARHCLETVAMWNALFIVSVERQRLCRRYTKEMPRIMSRDHMQFKMMTFFMCRRCTSFCSHNGINILFSPSAYNTQWKLHSFVRLVRVAMRSRRGALGYFILYNVNLIIQSVCLDVTRSGCTVVRWTWLLSVNLFVHCDTFIWQTNVSSNARRLMSLIRFWWNSQNPMEAEEDDYKAVEQQYALALTAVAKQQLISEQV